ncbi:hypothetical protein HPP92_024768 [Vanilla planifolia]|nr:hypothetical protein HPP92_024768 [Vanilla planifolia]
MARNSFEPHPMVAEAWDALRRSLVYFRGQPLGTIAAVDHASEEVLNYDQVVILRTPDGVITMEALSQHASRQVDHEIARRAIELAGNHAF